jgi:uncharacterized protein (TIGR03435 family)
MYAKEAVNLMIAHASRRLHRRVSLLLAAALVAALAPLARAQAGTLPGANLPIPASTPAAAPLFDVAAIHIHLPEPHEHSSIWSSPNDGEFRTANVTLKLLLQFAFTLPEAQILGGPNWVNSTRFDINAKSNSAVDAQMHGLTNDVASLQKQRMIQALLADRFRLAAHLETRELPTYALVAARGGPTFLQSKADGTSINAGNGKIKVEGGIDTVELLAEQLATQVGRPVVDKTGITGKYQLSLNWTPDEPAASPLNGSAGSTPAPPYDSGPSIFTALQEQLGLKLEPQKGPVQVLVIDHVELPTEN